MKRFSILFVIVAALFVSCDQETGIEALGFEIEKDTIYAAPEGGVESLLVTSGVEWIASSNQPWISISPANGIGSTKCSILVDSTLQNDLRDAKLTFQVEGEQYFVMVEQAGYGKFINLKDTVKTIASATNSVADRYFEVEVKTNVNFTVSIVDSVDNPIEWVTLKQKEVRPNLDRPSRPRSAKVRFDWKINPDTADRVAYVKFLPLNEADIIEKSAVLTLTQEAAPVIPDSRLGDSLAIMNIINRLQLLSPWDVSENMQYWDNITLWESTDKEILSGEVPREAVGRVRSANFMMCYTKESIPHELRYLRYIETLNIYSNVNTMLLSIDLGKEICDLEYLKHLQIGAFGLVSLPDEFVNLGDKLESLDLSSNNFEAIPAMLTKENFPKLKKLHFIDCRRWSLSDLRKKGTYEDGSIGLHFKVGDNDALRRLLLWDTLEELRLSNNYIEGELPTFTTIVDGDTIPDADVPLWTEEDVIAWGGDTIKNLVGMPKIMPHMKRLTLNLNFFTGDLPHWMLYHPHLLDWFPESLIYMQKENGLNSEGDLVKFDNEPTNYEKYYNFFPGYRKKYEIVEEFE